MIKKELFLKGYKSILKPDSPAIALGCCFIAIGELLKNIDDTINDNEISSNIKNKNNIRMLLMNEKKKLQKNFKIKIEYFELRKEKNLLISAKSNKSKIFISYYLRGIRLIDNF